MGLARILSGAQPSAKLCAAFGIGVFALFTVASAVAQDRRDDRGNGDRDRVARLDVGITVPVRVNESIDVDKGENRVYTGTVDTDVTGDNGRIIVPRGATAELMVRYAPDNDLNLDLESIVVNGQRYAVRTDEKHMDAQRDNSLVGSIVGAINGGEVRGRAVRIPRDSVVTFRLARPLVGVRPAPASVMTLRRRCIGWNDLESVFPALVALGDLMNTLSN